MPIDSDEIRSAVWACGENKSPGPDGFTFEFFRRFWDVIGPDFCLAVKWFFVHNSFAKGCNSSFIAPIPKIMDSKFINDYRPISLIGSLYKVVTKILAIRLSSVLDGLILEVQSAFLPNRQILDGPFIINEILSWCKQKRHQAMIFKILGSLKFGKASVLINGSPTSEFQFHCGLKQGTFKGLKLNNSMTISHLFYADDAVACDNEEQISWVKWSKVLSPKKHGGLGVSIFYALNHALLFKWVWRFIFQGNSLWARVISSIHGSNFQDHALSYASPWTSIIREV
nr:RNA-directed DNA polymerase, eukaryota, reverse transcriptase zinc-binding domain protein [Tanacetum cinerariifolium]